MKKLLLICCLCLLSMNLVHANAIETIAEGERYEFVFEETEPELQNSEEQDNYYRTRNIGGQTFVNTYTNTVKVTTTTTGLKFYIRDKISKEIPLQCLFTKSRSVAWIGSEEIITMDMMVHRPDIKLTKKFPPKFLYVSDTEQKEIVPKSDRIVRQKKNSIGYEINERFFDKAKDAEQVLLELTKTDGDKIQIVLKKEDVAKFMAICYADLKQIRREIEQK